MSKCNNSYCGKLWGHKCDKCQIQDILDYPEPGRWLEDDEIEELEHLERDVLFFEKQIMTCKAAINRQDDGKDNHPIREYIDRYRAKQKEAIDEIAHKRVLKDY